MAIASKSDPKPIPKVYTGALASLASVAVIALAKSAGIVLDPVLASAIVTIVFGAVSYLVPQTMQIKYEGHLDYLSRVADLLVSMHPSLSKTQVVERLEKPTATAQLIASASAIAELQRGRPIK